MIDKQQHRGLLKRHAPFHMTKECYLQITPQPLPFTFERLTKWYNGYIAFDGTTLCNLWSIAQALTTGQLGSFWVTSGDS
jgi:hypothetical protein